MSKYKYCPRCGSKVLAKNDCCNHCGYHFGLQVHFYDPKIRASINRDRIKEQKQDKIRAKRNQQKQNEIKAKAKHNQQVKDKANHKINEDKLVNKIADRVTKKLEAKKEEQSNKDSDLANNITNKVLNNLSNDYQKQNSDVDTSDEDSDNIPSDSNLDSDTVGTSNYQIIKNANKVDNQSSDEGVQSGSNYRTTDDSSKIKINSGNDLWSKLHAKALSVAQNNELSNGELLTNLIISRDLIKKHQYNPQDLYIHILMLFSAVSLRSGNMFLSNSFKKPWIDLTGHETKVSPELLIKVIPKDTAKLDEHDKELVKESIPKNDAFLIISQAYQTISKLTYQDVYNLTSYTMDEMLEDPFFGNFFGLNDVNQSGIDDIKMEKIASNELIGILVERARVIARDMTDKNIINRIATLKRNINKHIFTSQALFASIYMYTRALSFKRNNSYYLVSLLEPYIDLNGNKQKDNKQLHFCILNSGQLQSREDVEAKINIIPNHEMFFAFDTKSEQLQQLTYQVVNVATKHFINELIDSSSSDSNSKEADFYGTKELINSLDKEAKSVARDKKLDNIVVLSNIDHLLSGAKKHKSNPQSLYLDIWILADVISIRSKNRYYVATLGTPCKDLNGKDDDVPKSMDFMVITRDMLDDDKEKEAVSSIIPNNEMLFVINLDTDKIHRLTYKDVYLTTKHLISSSVNNSFYLKFFGLDDTDDSDSDLDSDEDGIIFNITNNSSKNVKVVKNFIKTFANKTANDKDINDSDIINHLVSMIEDISESKSNPQDIYASALIDAKILSIRTDNPNFAKMMVHPRLNLEGKSDNDINKHLDYVKNLRVVDIDSIAISKQISNILHKKYSDKIFFVIDNKLDRIRDLTYFDINLIIQHLMGDIFNNKHYFKEFNIDKLIQRYN